MPNLFGTDGIRGRSNKEMTPELAYKLGKAIAILLREGSIREAGHWLEWHKIREHLATCFLLL